MIPKVIHYCWFGGKPLDEKSKYCIASWEKFFPDYEIKRWDENNFDVNQHPFMKDAYERGKWAFVSDVARLIIVYENGGIYFDTDVEVLKSFEDILPEINSGYFGMEQFGTVATGLGFAAEPGNEFIKNLISIYDSVPFMQYEFDLSTIACPILTTDFMRRDGFEISDYIQMYRGFNIFPTEYFSPRDYLTGKLKITEKTHTIHWYSDSWKDSEQKKELRKMQILKNMFGNKIGEIVYGICNSIKNEGFYNYIRCRLKNKGF